MYCRALFYSFCFKKTCVTKKPCLFSHKVPGVRFEDFRECTLLMYTPMSHHYLSKARIRFANCPHFSCAWLAGRFGVCLVQLLLCSSPE